MNTTNFAESGEGFLSAAVRGWNRFWFRPADPTVLGLVRILMGLVGLYVHYAYTTDLLEFVGKDGWVNAETMREFRKEVPMFDRTDDWPDEFGESVSQRPMKPGELTRDDIEYMKRWDGNNPRLAARMGYYSWSIWYHVTDPTAVRIIHGCVLGIFVLLTLGVATRIMSVLAWLAALSYIQRHYVAFFGMDTILSFTLLYLAVGPSGAALSVDRLISRYIRAWRTLRSRGSVRKAGTLAAESVKKVEGLELDTPAPLVSANLALRLIQIHICIVYMASGTAKLMGNAWWSGTALWGTMVNPEFSPIHSPLYMGFIRMLCEHRWMWEVFMSGGVLFTLFFEISFAFLVWNRWTRGFMMLAAVMLHTGIAFFMGLTTFSLIMVAAVSSFTPPEVLQKVLRWLTQGRDSFQLGYAPRNRRQVRLASLVRAVDIWNQVHLLDHTTLHHGGTDKIANGVTAAPAVDSPLELVTQKERTLTGYALFERLTHALRLLWPLAAVTYVPGVAILGRSWYPVCDDCHVPLTADERRNNKGETVAH